MPRKKSTTTDLTAQSAALAEFGAMALAAAQQLHIQKKPVVDFPLDAAERAIADTLGIPETLQRKLAKLTNTRRLSRTGISIRRMAMDFGDLLARFRYATPQTHRETSGA